MCFACMNRGWLLLCRGRTALVCYVAELLDASDLSGSHKAAAVGFSRFHHAKVEFLFSESELSMNKGIHVMGKRAPAT